MRTSPALLALTALLVPEADAAELALMPPDTIPPPASDAQPELQPEVHADLDIASSGTIAQPEQQISLALVSETGSLFTQYVRFYQVLLLSLALSPAAAMTVFAVLRRRVVRYLTDEVRQELQGLEELETDLESRTEQADQLLDDLEQRLREQPSTPSDEIETLSQSVEVQLGEIQDIDGFREQRWQELQALLWTVYCNQESNRSQLAELTPETLLAQLKAAENSGDNSEENLENLELLDIPEAQILEDSSLDTDSSGAVCDRPETPQPHPQETEVETEVEMEVDSNLNRDSQPPSLADGVESDENASSTESQTSPQDVDETLASSPETREGCLILARDLEKQGRWVEAIAAYERALTYPMSKETETNPVSEPEPATTSDSNDNNLGSIPSDCPPETTPEANSSPDSLSFEALKQQAQELGDRRQWPACLEACQQALEHQKDAHLYKLLGNTFQALGNPREAQASYREALRLDSNFAEVYANLGSLYAQQQDWGRAIECFRRALRLQPRLAAAHRNFAKVWEKLGNEREALGCWHQALELDPDWAEGKEHLILGNRWVKLGQWEIAETCYRRAIARDANLLDAWHNLAEVLAYRQQWQTARDTYEIILQKDPQRVISQLGYARILANLEAWPEAIAQYHHLAEAAPAQVLAQHRFAQQLKEKGLTAEAISVYRRALDFVPDNFELQLGLAELLCQSEQWQPGLEAAQRAIALHGQVAKAQYYAGRCQVALEQWQAAAEHLQQAVSLDPQFFWSRYFWGKSLLALEEWQTAAEVLEAAMPLNPSFHWGYLELGQAWMQRQAYDKAVAAFQRVHELAPDTPWLAKKLADALRGRALEDMEQAVTWYRQAIAEHPQDLDNYHRALDLKSNDVDLYVQLADQLAQQNQVSGAMTFYQMALQIEGDREACGNHNRPDIKRKLEDLLKKKIT